MAIAFVAKGATRQFTNSTNVNPTVPTISANDLLLCFISHRDGGVTYTAPSGWALVPVQGGSTNPTGSAAQDANIAVYYKVAAGNESGTSPAWTASASGNGVASISAWSGVDTADPFDVDIVSNVMASSTSNIPVPRITTVTNGAWVIVQVGADEETTSANAFTAWPAGLTERADEQSGTSNVYNGYADVEMPTAGEFNSADGTVTSFAPDTYHTHVFAIKPAGGGGGGGGAARSFAVWMM